MNHRVHTPFVIGMEIAEFFRTFADRLTPMDCIVLWVAWELWKNILRPGGRLIKDIDGDLQAGKFHHNGIEKHLGEMTAEMQKQKD